MITMFYDSDCVLCTTNAYLLQEKSNDIAIIPVNQSIELLSQYGFSQIDAMTYVIVSDNQGNFYQGMNAIRLLYKTANMPMHQILYLPIIKQISDFLYPIIAKNRYKIPKWLIKVIYGRLLKNVCDTNYCQLSPQEKLQQNKALK